MKNRYVINLKYQIKPRMIKRWFLKDKKVYDLIEHSKGECWHDPSYGNGDGEFLPFDDKKTVYSFNTYAEADIMRQELEKL